MSARSRGTPRLFAACLAACIAIGLPAPSVLAEQAMKASPDDIDQRIHWIFRRLAGRPCDAFELQTLHELYDTQVADLQQDSQTAKALLANGESPPAKDVPAASAAATMYVVQAVLNADATIWKR